EKEKAVLSHIEQHRLIRQVRAAVPAYPGKRIVDAQRAGHHQPLDGAKPPVRQLGIDLLAAGIERPVVFAVDGPDIDALDAWRRLVSNGGDDVRVDMRHRVLPYFPPPRLCT